VGCGGPHQQLAFRFVTGPAGFVEPTGVVPSAGVDGTLSREHSKVHCEHREQVSVSACNKRRSRGAKAVLCSEGTYRLVCEMPQGSSWSTPRPGA
jgi:hypothetical protein